MLTKKVVRCLLASLAIIIGTTWATVAQTSTAKSQPPSRIVSAIDDSVRITIKGSAPAQARPENDIGRLDPTTQLERMILVIGASPDQEYQARTLLDSQQTKGSPDYHHWLTPEEFGQKFGPSAQDMAQVTGWLTLHGFTVTSVAKSGRWLEFSGTSAQVESTFQTQMRQYMVEGKVHVANASNISVPAALSPVVKGVLSLHNFFSKPLLVRSPKTATATYTPGKPGITFSDGTHAIVPADFARIYDLNPLYNNNFNGSNQTIAVVAASNINLSDIANFRSLFGLPANTPNVILNGPDPGVDSGGLGAEATLDTEWSGAVAPGATIDVVVGIGSLTTDPIALNSSLIVDQNLASAMNVSFGACEAIIGTNPQDGNAFWDVLWEQAAAQGISVFVAAGDTGAAGCDPNAPSSSPAQGGVAVSGFASTPFNTAVGGTQFNETINGGKVATFWGANDPNTGASVLGYIPEQAWNESCSPSEPLSICAQIGAFLFASGGGGVSSVYPTPSWQTLPVTGLSALDNFTLPNSSVHPRGLPDVSFTAAAQNDPYVFCFSVPGAPDCFVSGGNVFFNNLAGGTSFASPSFAGLMAIVDQKVSGRQGLANYVLYPLAAKETFGSCNSSNRTNPSVPAPAGCVFNDTTVGNNGVPGNDITGDPTAGALGFPTTAGYDLATGLGSVDANNLVTAWANLVAGFQGSTTTLSASFNGTPLPSASVTITHGQPVSVTVSVAKQNAGATQTPTGNIGLLASGGNLPSTVGITSEFISGSGGTATAGPVNVNNLPGGTSYNLAASFPGDGTFAGSSSNPISVTVGPENSTTSLRSLLVSTVTGNVTSGNTVAYGDGVNILAVDASTAGVSGLIPTSGTDTFTFNANPPISIGLDNSGIAEFIDCIFPSTSCLTPGLYTVTASYPGDGLSYNASTATGISITVTKGVTSLSISGPSAIPELDQFGLTAPVQLPPLGTVQPSGTVQFFDGGNAIGSPINVIGGQAGTNLTLTSTGNHSITAQYSGDNTYNGSNAPPLTINVTAPFEFLTNTSTSQTIAAGGTATFNLILETFGGFTAAINLSCSGAPGGATCTVSPNPANLNATTTSVPVTITVSNTANARFRGLQFKQLPFVFAGVLTALFGLRRRNKARLVAVFVLALIGSLVACGGGGNNTPPLPRPPTNAVLTVTATTGNLSTTAPLNLTITH